MNSTSDKPRARSGHGGRVAVTLGVDGIAAIPGPALILDRDGRLVASNGRAESLAGAIALGRLQCLPQLLAQPGNALVETLAVAGGGTLILELVALPAEAGLFLLVARDVTLERNLRAALVESRQRYKDLVEISSDFAWEVGPDGRFVFVSPRGALGFAADELVGRRPGDFVLGMADQEPVNVFETNAELEDVEVWMRQSGGSQACLLASATPIRGERGEWRGARGVCRDVTQERLRDAALARANNRERLLGYIVRTIRDEMEPINMLTVAAEATARALNATGCQIFRILPDGSDFELAAQFGPAGDEKPVLDSFLTSDHFDGGLGDWQTLATVCRYRPSINGALLMWRNKERAAWSDDDRLLLDDVANQIGLAVEQISNHERMVRLSRTDGLTGLFNRRAFFEEITRRFGRLAREGRPATLIYVDLDNFKAVNDVHGHQMGDKALLAVRELLLKHTRPVDLVARLGGDEFAVWLEGAGEDIALPRGQGLLAAGKSELAEFSGSPDKPLHFSLGLAVHHASEAETIEELIARADKAMYEVKRSGKGAMRLAPGIAETDQ